MMMIKLMLVAAIGMVSLGISNAEECCSGSINYIMKKDGGCTCGSKTCERGQMCSDGKCLYQEACPDGKTFMGYPNEDGKCGCGGRDSDTGCSRYYVCTASKKTCAIDEPPAPPACKSTFAALTGADSCTCGDRTCQLGHVACDATKNGGECSYATCPSSGAATNRCDCIKSGHSNRDTCYEGQTCKDGTCTYIVCKVGEKLKLGEAKYCDCGSNGWPAQCFDDQVCTVNAEGEGSCDYPKCSAIVTAIVTEKCKCGTSTCYAAGMTCSADEAANNQCGCTASKDLGCVSKYNNDVAAGTCPITCVGKKNIAFGVMMGKCTAVQTGPYTLSTTSFSKVICLKDGKSVKFVTYDNKDCSGDPVSVLKYEGCIRGDQTFECVYDEEKAAAAGLVKTGGAVSALKGQLGAVAAFAAMATAFVVAL